MDSKTRVDGAKDDVPLPDLDDKASKLKASELASASSESSQASELASASSESSQASELASASSESSQASELASASSESSQMDSKIRVDGAKDNEDDVPLPALDDKASKLKASELASASSESSQASELASASSESSQRSSLQIVWDKVKRSREYLELAPCIAKFVGSLIDLVAPLPVTPILVASADAATQLAATIELADKCFESGAETVCKMGTTVKIAQNHGTVVATEDEATVAIGIWDSLERPKGYVVKVDSSISPALRKKIFHLFVDHDATELIPSTPSVL